MRLARHRVRRPLLGSRWGRAGGGLLGQGAGAQPLQPPFSGEHAVLGNFATIAGTSLRALP